MMSRAELIIQLIKVALGLAFGAYFLWWPRSVEQTATTIVKEIPYFENAHPDRTRRLLALPESYASATPE
jgi:hypothetical protein